MKNKTIYLLVWGLLSISVAQAQTWEEWMEQDKTQNKYLMEQIAKLQMYLGYVKKGYSLVQEGLTTIGAIKNGDLQLHELFFNHLRTVNPQIRKYARVADIVSTQAEILFAYKKYNRRFQGAAIYSPEDLKYIYAVFSTLLADIAADIENLTTVISNGAVEMTDDERLHRIDLIYTAMQDKKTFFFTFCEQTEKQSHQRIKDHEDIKTLQKLY